MTPLSPNSCTRTSGRRLGKRSRRGDRAGEEHLLGAIDGHPMIEWQSQIDAKCRFGIAVVDQPTGGDEAIGHDDDRAVARHQPGGAPGDLGDATDDAGRGLDPVADAVGVVEIEGNAGEDVADDVAERKAGDGDQHARGRDEAGCLLPEDEDQNGDRGEDEHDATQQIAQQARILGRTQRRERGAVEQKIDQPRTEPRGREPGDHAG